jgi:FAD binding domain
MYEGYASKGWAITESNMTELIQTRCCIAGGGPAGMMLGFLLARAGVDVVWKSTPIFCAIFAATPFIPPLWS